MHVISQRTSTNSTTISRIPPDAPQEQPLSNNISFACVKSPSLPPVLHDHLKHFNILEIILWRSLDRRTEPHCFPQSIELKGERILIRAPDQPLDELSVDVLPDLHGDGQAPNVRRVVLYEHRFVLGEDLDVGVEDGDGMEAGLVRDGKGGVFEEDVPEGEGGEGGSQRAEGHPQGFAHKREVVGAESVNRSHK